MSRLLELLFPPRCVLCRGTVAEGEQICEVCAAEIQTQYAMRKRIAVAGCSDSFSPLQYKGKVRRALLTCKHGQKNGMGEWGSAQITACLAAFVPDWKPDCVTYIPTTLPHWWKRGFYLPAIFARKVAAHYGLACVPTLRRKWFAKSQLRMRSTQERQENARHTYFPRKGIDLTGKRVILIDDVLTTGATARACAALLHEMGAAEVFFVSLAKA